MSKSAMVWFDVPKTRMMESGSRYVKSGEVDFDSFTRDIADIGRTDAKESAEWQEEALKKTKIRVL